MTVITITRQARCKDCTNISLLRVGGRKNYICDLGHTLHKGKESNICRDDYAPRVEYHIKDVYETTKR